MGLSLYGNGAPHPVPPGQPLACNRHGDRESVYPHVPPADAKPVPSISPALGCVPLTCRHSHTRPESARSRNIERIGYEVSPLEPMKRTTAPRRLWRPPGAQRPPAIPLATLES